MWVPLAPETLQQVSALWTRAILTEWLGPVHSGHPFWTPGEVLLPPVPTWVSGGGRDTAYGVSPLVQGSVTPATRSPCLPAHNKHTIRRPVML